MSQKKADVPSRNQTKLYPASSPAEIPMERVIIIPRNMASPSPKAERKNETNLLTSVAGLRSEQKLLLNKEAA